MTWLIAKYALTAAVVVAISEIAKRSGRLGGLIAALPLITILALIWMHAEGQPLSKVGDFARYTFWYVLPTLPMFLVLPALLPRVGFWPSLAICAAVTVLCFYLLALGIRRFGVDLL
jgi:F0F1-type ATP synthase assembly protein I